MCAAGAAATTECVCVCVIALEIGEKAVGNDAVIVHKHFFLQSVAAIIACASPSGLATFGVFTSSAAAAAAAR